MKRWYERFVLLPLALCTACGTAYALQLSQGILLMEIPYGTTASALDTTCTGISSPCPVIANYRVEADESLWILTRQPGAQFLRHFQADSGTVASEIDRVPLPSDRGVFDDFLLLNGHIFLSRVTFEVDSLGRFYEFAADSLITSTTLSRSVQYNKRGGTSGAQLGRLTTLSDDIYLEDDAYGNSLFLGQGTLQKPIGIENVISGLLASPTVVVAQETLVITESDVPVLSLDPHTGGHLCKAFADGGFLISFARPATTEEGNGCRRFAYYDNDGALLRECVIPTYADAPSSVAAAAQYYTTDALYTVVFGVSSMELWRY